MEAVEELPLPISTDDVKSNIIEKPIEDALESPACHKSNGVDCEKNDNPGYSEATNHITEENAEKNICDHTDIPSEAPENTEIPSERDKDISKQENTFSVDVVVTKDASPEPEKNDKEPKQEAQEILTIDSTVNEKDNIEQKEICVEHEIITETTVEIDNIGSAIISEEVTFETEVFVEKTDSDVNDKSFIENQINDSATNILNDLGPSMELSEVFHASDVSENNNSAVKQEVFNKEELLDILEGNDNNEPTTTTIEQEVELPDVNQVKLSHAEIALQQLTRLKSMSMTTKKRKSYTSKGKKSDKKININDKLTIKSEPQKNTECQSLEVDVPESVSDKKPQPISDINSQVQVPKKIVNELVMDWEDDEPCESQSSTINEEVNQILQDSEKLKEIQENIIDTEENTQNITVDGAVNDDQSQKGNKSGDESSPRRLGRVIKKKVIFDPDNPDTFTKGKVAAKNKDIPINKDPTIQKKGKPDQVSQRSKSKSPLSKLQWKKPSAKNLKQNKRLSEVDKLLMDEGAVNMIYQLTPEALKGRKNTKTKAEFIKKIQSSTPNVKEMKFRERKKECLKYEDGEAKRILGGKPRPSLSSSVKSPSISEDFETHSADDSIIYRRHSSSSYSSSCMSPRRLSDVDTGPQNSSKLSNQNIPSENQNDSKSNLNMEVEEPKNKTVFKNEINNTPGTEVINKDDCLSIKEKLNSKLSLALNKRKRETGKAEKSLKQKKLRKSEESAPANEMRAAQYKFISIAIEHKVAVISIQKTGLKICVEVLKELQEALNDIDSRKDISTTLLASQCGTLCSSIELSLLLDENKEIKPNQAYELAETVRSLLSCVVKHSKLVVVGAWGGCAGVALALVALSDVALACEGATFALAAPGVPPMPGAAALTARCKHLPQALVNDLVVFGRRVSAAEALAGGLVSRVLWPDRFDEQLATIARDIASQPIQLILLKKKLLGLKTSGEAELSFLSCLEAERDQLVQYWTSVEGQEFLRASLDAA